MTWLLTAIYILVLILAAAVIVVVLFWESSLLFAPAPFIPTPDEVVPKIVQALDLQPGQTFYDLGCGDGKILLACRANQPEAKLIGIERSWLPYLIARFKTRHAPKDKIAIWRASLLKRDLSSADRMFVYLFPGLMAKLLVKLQKEAKPGLKVVSLDFEFKDKTPIEIIDLKRPIKALGQKLRIYQF